MLAEARLDKVNIKTSFSKAANSYDSVATLQRSIGKDLLATVHTKSLEGTVLDLGCGTGFLTGELLKLATYQQLIALDLALPMLEITQEKYAQLPNLAYICADAEYLPLLDNLITIVFSNVALQWCQNLPAVFNEIRRILISNGTLMFSTFGSQTLHELKTAWAGVDNFKHVNEFYNAIEIENFLLAAGYKQVQISVTNYPQEYVSVMDLMRELKGIGAHNVMAGRSHTMTGKSKMQRMINNYASANKNSITATFEVIKVLAIS